MPRRLSPHALANSIACLCLGVGGQYLGMQQASLEECAIGGGDGFGGGLITVSGISPLRVRTGARVRGTRPKLSAHCTSHKNGCVLIVCAR